MSARDIALTMQVSNRPQLATLGVQPVTNKAEQKFAQLEAMIDVTIKKAKRKN